MKTKLKICFLFVNFPETNNCECSPPPATDGSGSYASVTVVNNNPFEFEASPNLIGNY